ncbi:DMT family transporter [Desulfovibrio sp.]|uniref:DMT family transporter n=1 Tax=Desulfovibrio sp. TaxID=885 RepID=UPI0023D68E53|nr:DMT family transporter [Desulfovibrio sp.]MDE7241101.1 DMT family transporter [Desulfovibrio sp.]
MNTKVTGNLAMSFSKVCSGLNQNALRYLQPTWMDAVSGVFLRLVFAGASFWLIGLFTKKTAHGSWPKITWKDRLALLCMGMFLVYGYMLGLLLALTYSTPVSSSLIICTEPVWVLLMAAWFFHRPITRGKVLGIALGMAGCLVCILTQKSDDIATNPLLGNLCGLGGAIFYSIYLVASKGLLRKMDNITFNKWLFTGGAIAATAGVAIHGLYAPVLGQGLFSGPMLALLFVLVFPSTVSYLLVAVGIRDLPSTVVAIYGYVILIVSMAASYALGQDRFSWEQAVAVALIVLSVYLVEIADSGASGKGSAKPGANKRKPA